MKIYENIFNNLNIKQKGIVSIGHFDSMHLGHKKLLSELLRISREKGLANYILTYKNLPSKIKNGKKILELKDRLSIIKSLGIKNLILCDFDKVFYTLTHNNFINLLRKNFNINEYVIGKDFLFGYNKIGNVSTLNKSGCISNIIEPVYIDNQMISTSLIKKLIKNSNIKQANLFLGRNFFINGIVRKGKQIGRELGFPTMNIYNNKILFPHDGVYITKTHIKDKKYLSMTYIAHPVIETYLLNYNKYHYNFKISVDFFDKIRDNRFFKDSKLLKYQIEKDLIYLKNYYCYSVNSNNI